MIIQNIRITDKDFNGTAYKEFSIYVNDNRTKRLIQTTGKTPVVYVDEDGQVLDEMRLDQAKLTPGDLVTVWYDQFNKVSQIDVVIPDKA